MGKWKGWLITSVLFALWHLPTRCQAEDMSFTEGLVSCAEIIPIGLVMGYAMMRTGNVIAPGLLHTFANWAESLQEMG